MTECALLRLSLCSLMLFVAGGCGDVEQITRYAVPKEKAESEVVTPREDSDDVRKFEVNQTPAMAWFFKLLGPAEAVEAERERFDQLVASIRLRDGQPGWSLPDGWTQEAGSGMRFATLTAGETDPPLEVSVIRLPVFGERNEYLLQNINRWRGQVGLEPISELGEDVATVQSEGQSVTNVDFAGKTAEIEDARMLAAIVLPESPAATTRPESPGPMTPPAAAAPPERELPLTFKTPIQWQPGQTGMMRVAAFVVADGDKQVEITVIPAGGDLLSNVNRWRRQIELQPWSAEELNESSEELTADGKPASYVHLAGEEQSILAAVLPGSVTENGQQSWFFKLMGDPELAKREEDRFKAFVGSVELKK